MASEWANSGLDLHLDIDPARKAGSLEAALLGAIREERLAAGTRLPPSRSLAADLGIARNSVAEVYSRLVASGWLEARVGSGTWVSERPSPVPPPIVTRATRFDLDLRGGLPDGAAFPRAAWQAAAQRALAAAPASAFSYGETEGVPVLRAALADYLARTRGVTVRADDVILTHSFGELLALVARALVARGARRVAVEAYGHSSHRGIIVAAGLEAVPVPVDADGVDAHALAEASVDAVLLTPAHQFPLGVPLSPSRRTAVAEWARSTGGIVIEDDYDGEFRFDRRSIGALQALTPEHVVYGGTASKALSPALGIGWGVVPAGIRAEVLAQRRLSGSATDAITQLVLAEFVASGAYDSNVRSLRLRYRARRDRLEGLVDRALPGARVHGITAGLHCLLELPPGLSEDAATSACADRGLRVDGLASYAADAAAVGRPPTLVVGFGAPPEHRFDEALSTLVDALNDVRLRRSRR
jgi:GntR family transcriptional regulator/MocR family aminotransferase